MWKFNNMHKVIKQDSNADSTLLFKQHCPISACIRAVLYYLLHCNRQLRLSQFIFYF